MAIKEEQRKKGMVYKVHVFSGGINITRTYPGTPEGYRLAQAKEAELIANKERIKAARKKLMGDKKNPPVKNRTYYSDPGLPGFHMRLRRNKRTKFSIVLSLELNNKYIIISRSKVIEQPKEIKGVLESYLEDMLPHLHAFPFIKNPYYKPNVDMWTRRFTFAYNELYTLGEALYGSKSRTL